MLGDVNRSTLLLLAVEHPLGVLVNGTAIMLAVGDKAIGLDRANDRSGGKSFGRWTLLKESEARVLCMGVRRQDR